MPRALPQAQVDAILAARHEHRFGPHRLAPLVEVPRSTIGDVLHRHGLSRLRDQDGPTGIPVRYVRERPGELLHIDVKKLGRIPEGGGHRVLGRVTGTPRTRGAGYDYLHVAVDDMSRVAYVGVFDDERGTTCARFVLDAAAFFASHGVRIERVLTDNAKNYTLSKAFAGALEGLGARHKVTRPFRPQTNGKAERFNGTLLTEWAYVRRYDTNQARLDALPAFIAYYNERRPHGSLDGQSPMTALVNNVSGNHS
jgi:transposase InsO family protein